MNKKIIIKKSKEMYCDRKSSDAFVCGAEYVLDYLSKIPFPEIMQELHCYTKEKLDRKEPYDEHK